MPIPPISQPNPPGLQVSALELITSAMRQIGVCAAGEQPSPEEAADGLATLNQMLESWNTERLNIYTIKADTYTLQDGKSTYTIGGPGIGADFDSPRPVAIQNANIILTTNSPNVRVPLYLMNDDEYSQIAVLAVPSTIPRKMYNDGAYPLSSLIFWGVPSGSMQLELFTWQQLGLFGDLTTTWTFPPGYQRALKFNLAVELANEYGPSAIALAPTELASKSKSAIQNQNSPNLLMECDPASLSSRSIQATTRRVWNIYTGL